MFYYFWYIFRLYDFRFKSYGSNSGFHVLVTLMVLIGYICQIKQLQSFLRYNSMPIAAISYPSIKVTSFHIYNYHWDKFFILTYITFNISEYQYSSIQIIVISANSNQNKQKSNMGWNQFRNTNFLFTNKIELYWSIWNCNSYLCG